MSKEFKLNKRITLKRLCNKILILDKIDRQE